MKDKNLPSADEQINKKIKKTKDTYYDKKKIKDVESFALTRFGSI